MDKDNLLELCAKLGFSPAKAEVEPSTIEVLNSLLKMGVEKHDKSTSLTLKSFWALQIARVARLLSAEELKSGQEKEVENKKHWQDIALG